MCAIYENKIVKSEVADQTAPLGVVLCRRALFTQTYLLKDFMVE